MQKHLRLNEYKVLLFRISLAYLFYFIARVLFYFFNADLLRVESISDFLSLCYYGLTFDTTAILYVNLLFIVFSILPFWKNAKKGYQKFLFYLYFSTNLLAYGTNFVDFIYYKFTFARTTIVALNVLEHETNKTTLLLNFLVEYWYVFVLFLVFSLLWIFLYKKVEVEDFKPTKHVAYFGFSSVGFVFIVLLVIAGIRGGDFKKSTRPINLLDASRNVKNIVHSDIVLNTPFAIIRTLFTNSFLKVNYADVTAEVIEKEVQPVKMYRNNPKTKPNVVVLIVESFSLQYFIFLYLLKCSAYLTVNYVKIKFFITVANINYKYNETLKTILPEWEGNLTVNGRFVDPNKRFSGSFKKVLRWQLNPKEKAAEKKATEDKK